MTIRRCCLVVKGANTHSSSKKGLFIIAHAIARPRSLRSKFSKFETNVKLGIMRNVLDDDVVGLGITAADDMESGAADIHAPAPSGSAFAPMMHDRQRRNEAYAKRRDQARQRQNAPRGFHQRPGVGGSSSTAFARRGSKAE